MKIFPSWIPASFNHFYKHAGSNLKSSYAYIKRICGQALHKTAGLSSHIFNLSWPFANKATQKTKDLGVSVLGTTTGKSESKKTEELPSVGSIEDYTSLKPAEKEKFRDAYRKKFSSTDIPHPFSSEHIGKFNEKSTEIFGKHQPNQKIFGLGNSPAWFVENQRLKDFKNPSNYEHIAFSGSWHYLPSPNREQKASPEAYILTSYIRDEDQSTGLAPVRLQKDEKIPEETLLKKNKTSLTDRESLFRDRMSMHLNVDKLKKGLSKIQLELNENQMSQLIYHIKMKFPEEVEGEVKSFLEGTKTEKGTPKALKKEDILKLKNILQGDSLKVNIEDLRSFLNTEIRPPGAPILDDQLEVLRKELEEPLSDQKADLLIKNLTFQPHEESITNYREYLRSIHMSPREIIERFKDEKARTVIMDYAQTMKGLKSFLSLLRNWAQEEGLEDKLKEALQIHILYLDEDKAKYKNYDKTIKANLSKYIDINHEDACIFTTISDEDDTFLQLVSKNTNYQLLDKNPFQRWSGSRSKAYAANNEAANLIRFQLLDYWANQNKDSPNK